MRKLVPALVCIAFFNMTFGQRVGDCPTAGFTSNRTYLNAQTKNFRPPLHLLETIDLTEVDRANSLIAFEGRMLISEMGSPMYAPTKYHLYAGHNRLWTVSIPDGFDSLDYGPVYIPAYSSGRVILGGAKWPWNSEPGATFIRMVDSGSGATIWENSTVGDTAFRSPVLTHNLAVFHGEKGVVAADPATGAIFWQYPTTTENAPVFARAPLSVFGNTVYLLDWSEKTSRP